MDKKELKIILNEGEGYKIEFKESISGLEKELAAFANSSGGKIFLGITDDGEIKGIEITNALKSRIQDIANNCRPRIKISVEDIDNILIINVREGQDKPYECSSGFYKRIGTNSQKMTRNEILDFFKSEGKVRFDELIEPKFNYPKDFDKKRLMTFLKLAELSKSIATETILVNLDVAKKQERKLYFNNSGVLFFAKTPQRFIPDRIRIENYWQKPPNFVLGKTVFRRNHIIADLFARIHFGEKMGTGFERIREICKKENAPFPEIEFDENYFYVTFRQSKEYLKLAEKEKRIEEKSFLLNDRQRKALEFIKQNGRLTMKEYIELCPDVNRKTLTRDLTHLIKLGMVIRKGKGRRDLHYLIS